MLPLRYLLLTYQLASTVVYSKQEVSTLYLLANADMTNQKLSVWTLLKQPYLLS
jgi:hypothetical protein